MKRSRDSFECHPELEDRLQVVSFDLSPASDDLHVPYPNNSISIFTHVNTYQGTIVNQMEKSLFCFQMLCGNNTEQMSSSVSSTSVSSISTVRSRGNSLDELSNLDEEFSNSSENIKHIIEKEIIKNDFFLHGMKKARSFTSISDCVGNEE